MTLPIKTQFIASGLGVGALLVGTIFSISSYWMPRLVENHRTLAQNQAAITSIQRQQQNLSGVSEQLTERQAQQTTLNQDLWAFSNEGTFYELWDPIATATQTEITLDSISDATPGAQAVRRDATLTIIGSLPNVWQAVARLSGIHPIVVIQDVQFTPGDKAPSVVARVTLSTLWYDDTLH